MTHLYALARELARPVARGHLCREQAEDWLLAATLSKRHQIGGLDPENIFRYQIHLLRLWLDRHRDEQAIARGKITRRLMPLLARQAPANQLLAEAHDVNGSEGFPLTDEAVTMTAFDARYWANRRERSAHHGR